MSGVVRSWSTDATTGSGHVATITPGEPIGTAQDDVLLFISTNDWESSLSSPPTITGPTDWIEIASGPDTGSLPTPRFIGKVYAIRRGVSAPSYTASLDTTINGGPTLPYLEGMVIAVSGIPTSVALTDIVVATENPIRINPDNPTPPQITTNVNASLNICVGLGWNGATSVWSPPSTYAIGEDGSALGVGSTLTFAYKTITTAGKESPGSFSGGVATTGANWATCIGIPPSSPSLPSLRLKSQTPSVAVSGTGVLASVEPGFASADDILLYGILFQNSSGNTEPVGWVPLATQVDTASGSSKFFAGLYAVRRGSTPPSFYVDDAGSHRYVEAIVSVWSGVDPAIALSSLVVTSATPTVANPSNPTPPPITTIINGSINVCYGFSWGGSSGIDSFAPPSGYTKGGDGSIAAGAGAAVTFGYKTIATAGTETPGAFSGAAVGSQPSWSVCVALPPPAVVGIAPQSRIVRQAMNRSYTY